MVRIQCGPQDLVKVSLVFFLGVPFSMLLFYDKGIHDSKAVDMQSLLISKKVNDSAGPASKLAERGQGKRPLRIRVTEESIDSVDDSYNASIVPLPFDCSADQTINTIIYNRVPKSGSTTLLRLMKRISLKRSFDLIYNHEFCAGRFNAFGLRDAQDFVGFLDRTARIRKKKIFAEGHIRFFDMNLDIMAPSLPKPVKFIQLVREPLALLLSFFYFDLYLRDAYSDSTLNRTLFVMYGYSATAKEIRSRNVTFIPFDACVTAADGGNASLLPQWCSVPLTLVPWFCGHEELCRDGRSAAALARAKSNYHKYHFVGLTEEMEASVAILERTLPGFFAGASAAFNQGPGGGSISRRSVQVADSEGQSNDGGGGSSGGGGGGRRSSGGIGRSGGGGGGEMRANRQRAEGYEAYVQAAVADGRLDEVRRRLGPDIELYEYVRADFRRKAAICGM